jgi:glycosyltransferase involved in cell wall biosynthesis
MRILIPVLNFGKSGGYRVLSKIADELIHLGHKVDFMSPETSIVPYYPTIASIKWIDKNGKIINHPKEKFVLNESGISTLRKLINGLQKLPKNSYDVIIANHSVTVIAIKRAGLIHKTLYYVQAYEPELYDLLAGFKNKILSYLSVYSYKMKLFTIVNAEVYLNYKKLNASRVLYPGIDFNNFYPIQKKVKNTNKIIIGTIGRIEPQKGTRYVLEAFNTLKKKYTNLRLHVAFGNPDDFSEYEDVYCFQPQGDRELGDFYRTLDYYICAGYTQFGAFHYPVAEAMSCGISLITTQYYPVSEINAWITIPQNAEDIVKRFELAQNNPTLQEKKINQALNDVKQFSWKKVGEKFNSYINEFINSNK